nr:TetR family transcriptional regulator [Actinomycetospora sp. TBRC 11914]
MSRRDRPAKPALSREAVVAAAVELVRAHGTERVTMRRLAQELDTGPASLYVYVRDTASLHAAVLDVFLGEVDLAPVTASGGDPRDRLRAVLSSYTEVLYARPGLARTALVTHPSGPHYLALVDGLLALLDAAGVPPDRAAWAVDVLLLVATATAAEHGTRDAAPSTAAAEDDEFAAALSDADPAVHPHIAALGADLLSGSGPDRTRWFVDVLVAGARTTSRPAKETR